MRNLCTFPLFLERRKVLIFCGQNSEEFGPKRMRQTEIQDALASSNSLHCENTSSFLSQNKVTHILMVTRI